MAALAAIVGFFLLVFGRFLLHGTFLIGGDVFFYTLPLRTMAWQIIRSGSLPLWTPSVLSGFPLLAMSQLGLAYPLTWGHLFLSPEVAEQIYVLSPFILAPAFTYAYLREINRSHIAALIGALSFGYGGLMTNTYGMNAIPTNALMWLPLLLIAIERARTRRLMPCLISGSLIASLSLLTGHGGSTLQIAVIAVGYSAFSSITTRSRRWQPLIVGLGSFLFGAALTAFQILETMRAVRRSIRDKLTFEFFTAGSVTTIEFVKSLLVPLNHYTEVTAYQAPLLLCMAVFALLKYTKTDRRVLFWAVVAAMGAIMMLGQNGYLYSLLYRIPVFNLFRRPSRYAFEWTFGISVLAGFAYDALPRRSVTEKKIPVFGLLGWLLCVLLAAIWYWRIRHGASDTTYLTWKVLFIVSTSLLFIFCLRTAKPNLLTATLLLICFVEPFILITIWWSGTEKTSTRLHTPALTTTWLQKVQNNVGRVYVRANGPEEETRMPPRFDALARTAMFALPSSGGYEPLFPERYSRALGGVSFDALTPRPGYRSTAELFDSKSHVLDLLNTTHVVRWAPTPKRDQDQFIERSGIQYRSEDIAKELKAQQTFTLKGVSARVDSLALVTSLANSVDISQGTEIAEVHIFTTDNEVIKFSLRAGVDTAEWAHERPDVKPNIRHNLAPVFDKTPVGALNTYPAFRFETRLYFCKTTLVDYLTIKNTTTNASVAVWKATLFDSTDRRSNPLSNDASDLDPARWISVAEFDGVVVLANKRALPRVWLTHEAKAVDDETALHAIQGLGPEPFDPRKTALLEVDQGELPELTDVQGNSGDSARVLKYDPNQIVIETDSGTNSVLVVSEAFYPGWKATVDNEPATILLADYLLRAILLPAGKHQVVMYYTAPAAMSGAIISSATVVLLAVMFIYPRRR